MSQILVLGPYLTYCACEEMDEDTMAKRYSLRPRVFDDSRHGATEQMQSAMPEQKRFTAGKRGGDPLRPPIYPEEEGLRVW